MKLLLENWRLYSGEYDFNILCENHKHGLISEAQLLETWEKQVLTEMDQLLDEGMMDVLKIGYEKGKQLVGKAKETWDAAIEKLAQFYLNLCIQAWGLIQRIKRGLEKVAAVLKKALGAINKFCIAHPILCKVVKLLLMMLAVAAVVTLFSSEANAAVDMSKMPQNVFVPGAETPEMVLNDTGVNAIKGLLHQLQAPGQAGVDKGIQQSALEAFKWLEKAHGSENFVDLANAQGQGAELVRDMYETLDAANRTGPGALQHYSTLGEKIAVGIRETTSSALSGGKLETAQFQFQSLVKMK